MALSPGAGWNYGNHVISSYSSGASFSNFIRLLNTDELTRAVLPGMLRPRPWP